MRFLTFLFLASCAAIACRGGVVDDGADLSRLQVADGFEVSHFAGDELATNIYSLCFDARGRVVVSGPGYVSALVDDDGDGRADRAEVLSDRPEHGAQGMYFDGGDLIFVGDGTLGRMRGGDDGRLGPEVEAWCEIGQSEHGGHAVRRGPDGQYYVMAGNTAGVDRSKISVANPRIARPVAGTLFCCGDGGEQLEVLADGFRNAYDFAFNSNGHVFTVDSDGERVHHLPWYTPTRLFDIAPGWSHGWLGKGRRLSWSPPAAIFDSAPRLAERGRGSPTGMVCYRHHRFPRRYHGGLFALCWTFGRVDFFPLAASGSGYATTPEVFLEADGGDGFAPVDAAVGPTGDLYIAVGGRNTRGSVYRIRATAKEPGEDRGAPKTPLASVLLAPQPLASWSRAQWLPLAKLVGREAISSAARDEARGAGMRRRAVEILVDAFGGLTAREVEELARSVDPAVRAAAAWSAPYCSNRSFAQTAVRRLTYDANARVARAAWEALATTGAIANDAYPAPDWTRAESTPDRRIRAAMTVVARGVGRASYAAHCGETLPPKGRAALTRLWVEEFIGPARHEVAEDRVAMSLRVFHETTDQTVRLDAVRILQVILGGVSSDERITPGLVGYSTREGRTVSTEVRRRVVDALIAAFPSGDAVLDRELGRIFAMIEAAHARLPAIIATRWTSTSTVEDDLHYLMVMARVGGERERWVTQATADALCHLHDKLDRAGGFASRHWPERVELTFRELWQRDASLPDAVVRSTAFGRAEHSDFVEVIVEPLRTVAATAMLARLCASDVDDEAWTPQAIRVMSRILSATDETSLREALLPALRDRFHIVSLQGAIVDVLSRHPDEVDRNRLVESLRSVDPETVRAAAIGLKELTGASPAGDIAEAIGALIRHSTVDDTRRKVTPASQWESSRAVRTALLELISSWTGVPFQERTDADFGRERYTPVLVWFEVTYPELYRAHMGRGTPDQWNSLLAQAEWEQGSAQRGRIVFEARSCRKCHGGNALLGPALGGVATRMSPYDLFAAVLDPSRDVAEPYRSVQVLTADGRVVHGVPVYESPESTLIQVASGETVRIRGNDIATVVPSTLSLMPTGLLDGATPEELADLYAYLRTLTK